MTVRTPNSELVPWPTLERCFEVTEEEMKKEYGRMDWHNAEVRYLRRNALIAIGNSGERGLGRITERFEDSDDHVLRDHARWALSRLR
jgi:epoxyqueuosine reductase QueG